MNRLLILLVSLSNIIISTFGQTVITMERSGGVYMIPCIVNGVGMKMVFDTGASDVTISIEKAKELLSQGKLNQDDFLGAGQSLTASGDVVDHLEINLKTIQIGGQVLKNTRAVIISGQNAPLLLGLSAIQKLGKIILDGNKIQISPNMSHHTRLRNQVADCILEKNYSQAIRLLKKLESEISLEADDLCLMILCYSKIKQFENCLDYCSLWLEENDKKNARDRRFVYEQVCYCLFELGAYKEAISVINRTMEQISSEDLKSRYVWQMGSCYYFLSDLDMCFSYYYKSTTMRLGYLGYTESDVLSNKVHDKLLGDWYERLSMGYSIFTKDENKAKNFAILGAKCGNREAIDFCNHFNLNYK